VAPLDRTQFHKGSFPQDSFWFQWDAALTFPQNFHQLRNLAHGLAIHHSLNVSKYGKHIQKEKNCFCFLEAGKNLSVFVLRTEWTDNQQRKDEPQRQKWIFIHIFTLSWSIALMRLCQMWLIFFRNAGLRNDSWAINANLEACTKTFFVFFLFFAFSISRTGGRDFPSWPMKTTQSSFLSVKKGRRETCNNQ
jgi:hypothetical protein